MKKQFSLATLLCTAITIQVCLALCVGLPKSRLLASVIVCEAFFAIGVMWSHKGTLERDRKRRELAKKKDAYTCPYCGEVFQTHKAFPVCKNCSSQTRSRGPP